MSDLRDDLAKAMEETKDNPVEENIVSDVPEIQPEVEIPVDQTPEVQEELEPVPQSWSPDVKEKWKDIPPDVRKFILKREEDVHKGFTKQDEEKKFAREIKEVVAPYEATIRAEGGTPQKAVSDLLNTAYVLRTGDPHQKAQIIQKVIQQYGVDMGLLQSNYQDDPYMRQIAQMQSSLPNPEQIKKELREEMERDRVQTEVQAFAAKPENKHFETVKGIMGSLLQNGTAKDLPEAYEMACNAHPQVRSTLQAEQQAKNEEKRRAEMLRKSAASASVSGSSTESPPANKQDLSLRQELEKQMAAFAGSAI